MQKRNRKSQLLQSWKLVRKTFWAKTCRERTEKVTSFAEKRENLWEKNLMKTNRKVVQVWKTLKNGTMHLGKNVKDKRSETRKKKDHVWKKYWIKCEGKVGKTWNAFGKKREGNLWHAFGKKRERKTWHLFENFK